MFCQMYCYFVNKFRDKYFFTKNVSLKQEYAFWVHIQCAFSSMNYFIKRRYSTAYRGNGRLVL